MPRYDNLPPEQLETIRKFIEESDTIDGANRARGTARAGREALAAPAAQAAAAHQALGSRARALCKSDWIRGKRRSLPETPVAQLKVRHDLLGYHFPVNAVSLSAARLRHDLR